MKKDTIVAIATAMSSAGIGIVRISGNEAIEIIQKIFRGKKRRILRKKKHIQFITDILLMGKKSLMKY